MNRPDTSHPAVLSRRAFLARSAAAAGSLPLLGLAPSAGPVTDHPGNERALCVFSKHLQWLDYDAMAETAAETGFDGVDLTVRPRGHVLPERVEDDLPRAVDAVRKAGLAVPLITTAVTDPADPHTEPILRTAGALGIGYYRMGYLSYRDDRGIAESLDAYRPRLRDLAAMNAHYGLHGAYQNHAGTRVGGPVWDLWILLRDLDPRWIGCQYDIRHATVEGGQAWPLGLKLLHPYIKTTVLKDFEWAQGDDGRGRVENVPLGEGMVDFPAYLALVKQYRLDGPISLHYEYPLPDELLPLAARRQETVAVMQKDVQRARHLLQEAGL